MNDSIAKLIIDNINYSYPLTTNTNSNLPKGVKANFWILQGLFILSVNNGPALASSTFILPKVTSQFVLSVFNSSNLHISTTETSYSVGELKPEFNSILTAVVNL